MRESCGPVLVESTALGIVASWALQSFTNFKTRSIRRIANPTDTNLEQKIVHYSNLQTLSTPSNFQIYDPREPGIVAVATSAPPGSTMLLPFPSIV